MRSTRYIQRLTLPPHDQGFEGMLVEPRSEQKTEMRRRRRQEKIKDEEYLAFPCAKISVTDGSEEDSKSHFQSLRRIHFYFLHHQSFSSSPCHSRCSFIHTQHILTQPLYVYIQIQYTQITSASDYFALCFHLQGSPEFIIDLKLKGDIELNIQENVSPDIQLVIQGH